MHVQLAAHSIRGAQRGTARGRTLVGARGTKHAWYQACMGRTLVGLEEPGVGGLLGVELNPEVPRQLGPRRHLPRSAGCVRGERKPGTAGGEGERCEAERKALCIGLARETDPKRLMSKLPHARSALTHH